MFDILGFQGTPRVIGRIDTDARVLARTMMRIFSKHQIFQVRISADGTVYAHDPAREAGSIEQFEIIGTYRAAADTQDLAEDLSLAFTEHMNRVGMFEGESEEKSTGAAAPPNGS
jgi:hypothetical protein